MIYNDQILHDTFLYLLMIVKYPFYLCWSDPSDYAIGNEKKEIVE